MNKIGWFCLGAIFALLLFLIFSMGYDYVCLDVLEMQLVPYPGGIL